MKYCPFCGSGLQEEMIFCPKCGKRFLGVIENPETEDTKNEGFPASNEAEPPLKKNAKKAFCIAAVFVIVIGTLGFFGITKPSKDAGVPETIESAESASVTDAANSVLYLEVCDDADNVIATASGFVIEEGTTLVTNFHVIDGAHHIIAHTPDGKNSVEIHTVLAYNETADLAVLEFQESIGVPSLRLGDSDLVKQGDAVFAVGYPLGLANTLSDGVIGSRYFDENNIDVLQITAAISSGSSGGALFNTSGEVIGVICASYVDGQNLNIAIASNLIIPLLENSDRQKLEDFYEPSNSVLTVEDVLLNHDKLDGEYVFVGGYISSAFAYSSSDTSVVDYRFVNAESDVYGANYADRLYDLDEFIELFRKEKQRALNYGLITIEVDWTDRWSVVPGDFVVLYGKVETYNKAGGTLALKDCAPVN